MIGDESIYDDLTIKALKPMVIKKMQMCSKGCCYDEVEVHLDIGQMAEVERFMIDAYDIDEDYTLQ